MFNGQHTPGYFQQVARESRDSTESAQYESEVNALLNDTLVELNSRDSEEARERLREIKDILEDDLGQTVEMRYGGSVKKHTYVDGLSDVDVLLLVDKTELSGSSPAEVLEYIADSLRADLPSGVTDIRVGNMAVTLTYGDGSEFQLLPASRRQEGYRIPNESGNEWSGVVRPDAFASKLTEVNQMRNGRVVPAIKLAKVILSESPLNSHLSGYHIESMAIEAAEDYPEDRSMTTKEMLRHFFEHGHTTVLRPIKDKTGQSLHVDDYLGPENSEARTRISNQMHRVARRIQDADDARSMDEWDALLGDDQ
jgi:hypothetical protein